MGSLDAISIQPLRDKIQLTLTGRPGRLATCCRCSGRPGCSRRAICGGTCPCALDHAREKATRFTCRRPGALSPGARVDSTVGMAPSDAPLPDPLPARLAPCPPVHPSDLANVLLLVPPCWRRAGAPSRWHCAFSGGELHPDFPSTTGFWGGRSGRPAPWPDACSVCSSPPSFPPKRTS